MKSSSRMLITAVVGIVSLLSPTSVGAGGGEFDTGEFNFCVSMRFNASAAQLSQLRSVFQEASDVLLDATNGQHRFGTVTVVNDSGASDNAEYWVNDGAGRANASPDNYSVRGEHVMLYVDDDLTGGTTAAYTVAHEHAHQAYGVRDEYSGPSGFLGLFEGPAECAPAPDPPSLDYCLMGAFKSRGTSPPALDEFCVAGNHDPDGDTYQEHVHGESCWETIANHPTRGAAAPAGTPTAAPPASVPVTFVDGFGGLRVMLVLDRSGSMGVQNRMEFAKRGANTFLRFVEVGDGIGVASFNCTPRVDFALQEVTSDSTIAAARGSVNGLSPGGGTNIGGGLSAGLAEITAQPNRSCNEIIVLLSDGDHNCGQHPSAVIPALRSESVTVFTVGVGSGISAGGQATLLNVARATGGRFFRVANSFDLVGLFLRLGLESIGGDLLAREPLDLAAGQVREVGVPVEPGVDRATFALTYANASAAPEFTLRSPSGEIISDSFMASSASIVEVVEEPNLIAYRVTAPEAGLWTLVAAAGAVAPGPSEILAFAEHDGTQLNVTVAADPVQFPEAASLRVVPRFEGEMVTGANVQGLITRPDGSQIPVAVFDSGLPEHGDARPGDGLYSALFDEFNEDGVYLIEVVAETEDAFTHPGESIEDDQPSNRRPVPDFRRVGTGSFVVEGVPDFVVGTLEMGPETVNLKSRGRFVTAYVELPEGFSAGDIAVSSVAVTAIDGVGISPIPAEARPSEVGDFDGDGTPDLMVKFDRQELHERLDPGSPVVRVEGLVGGQLFVAERGIAVIDPGR